MFSEKISTRIKVRPEFTKAMDFARTIKKAVPHQRVVFTVHEMKRLGRGAALFAFSAGMAEPERVHPGEVPGGPGVGSRARPPWRRPKVVDADMAAYARSLRAHGVPVPEIARELVIPSGKNKGRHPSVATVCRILAEDDAGPTA